MSLYFYNCLQSPQQSRKKNRKKRGTKKSHHMGVNRFDLTNRIVTLSGEKDVRLAD